MIARRFAVAFALVAVATGGSALADPADKQVPVEITQIMNAPKYAGATWGLRAVDLATTKPVSVLGPDALFFTGSVRKLFSVGVALNALGSDHRFLTPVYRLGEVTAEGVLDGDLVLVASGDLTLGGRDQPDGTVAFTNFDHTYVNGVSPIEGIGAVIKVFGDEAEISAILYERH